jgi:iron-sulfur cluster repair protein YtfE (RIC family)
MEEELKRVIREHDDLDSAAGSLEALLHEGPEKLPLILEARSTFANDLSEHLLKEHDVLELALARRGNGDQFSRKRLDEELERLRWDWEECLASWDEESAAAQWDLFAEHTAALLSRVRRRISLETDLLRT